MSVQAADGAVDATESVIVTGTREDSRLVRESLIPVDVVSASELEATGQVSLLDALRVVLPSLGTPAVGYDVGALARTFQLRGLSPAHTLVLVNGKRRHASASLYADSDPAQGANAVDLDFIPVNAVDHVEVLKDGAAAQYGSDAIAGVVNIILKNTKSGGSVSALAGGYTDGGGATGQVDGDAGFKVGAGGSLHLSLGWRDHDFSNRSADSGGVQPARVQGDPRSRLLDGSFNFEDRLEGGVSIYSFGTLGQRDAAAWENPRQPGWLSDAVDAVYPDGFAPQERVHEVDQSLTGGIKGTAGGGWDWDLGLTYGADREDLRNVDTINPDLLADESNAQTAFSVGGFDSSDLTLNLDFKRRIQADGLSAPLTLAWGLQARREGFRIRAGEPNSYYLGGSQAFPGFRPTDAVDAHRDGAAAYVDLTARLTSAWEVATAVRAEKEGGVGDSVAGKLSSRFEITPTLAWRGTVSNGFHAPTLAQEYYSATTVTTGAAQIQLPLGSAGAKLLGAPDLRPEKSKSLTTGLVFEPAPGLHASLDAYLIDIDNRIIQSSSIYGSLALAAITANGVTIPSGVSSDDADAAFFTNGVDTRTRGIDLDLQQRLDLAGIGQLNWQVGGGYTATTIRRVHAAPGALADAGLTLVDVVQRSNLTTATPHAKITGSGTLRRGDWGFSLRETFYGATSQTQGYAPGPYYVLPTRAAFITDLAASWYPGDRLTISIGGDNVFNRYPNEIPLAVSQTLNYDRYSHVSPYGINGGYWYSRVTYDF